MYAMVDFICIGLVDLRGTRSKRTLHNETFLPIMGFEYTSFRLQDLSDNHSVTDLIWLDVKMSEGPFFNQWQNSYIDVLDPPLQSISYFAV